MEEDLLFYPWGQVWQQGGTDWVYRYGGMAQRDTAVSLDPAWFRHYNSGLGRWLSPDPMGGEVTNPQSLNRYAYVLNNPTNFIDPLGLDIYCNQLLDENGNVVGLTNCMDNGMVVVGSNRMGGVNGGGAGGGGLMHAPLLDIGPGQSPGGGGKPTIRLAPNPSWGSAFAKAFVNNLKQDWDKGCFPLFLKETAKNLNPFPAEPSLNDLVDPAAQFFSAVKFNSALAYAASRGLTYPLKSSVFRGTLAGAFEVLDAVPALQLDAAMLQSLHSEYQAAATGQCQ